MDFSMSRKLVFLLFLCGISLAGLRTEINSVINESSQAKVSYGVRVVDAESGKAVYEHNADKALIPASNMKIFSTIAAMNILKTDYEFKTGIYYQDKDIVVKGSGDPLLGDQVTLAKNKKEFGWELQAIVQAMRENQITEVGNIIVDSSVFDDRLVNPSWAANELNRSYSAEVSGINYNGNCIDVIAYPHGSRVGFTITPPTNYVSITNKASVNVNKQNTVWVSRLPQSNKMTLYGKCHSRTAPFQVTVHRPAVYFGYLLAEKLISKGVVLKGSVIEHRREIAPEAKKLIEFSTPLKDVVTRSNRDSFNLAAEALVKKISAVKTQGAMGGQWEHAGELISKVMEGFEIDTTGFVFDDGCGLSRKNEATAMMISELLLEVYKSPDRAFFIESLAVGGEEGSSPVSRYFKEPQYKGKVYAKSGTISGVKALSGYCYTQNGVYIFSIITNNANWKSRAAINTIVKSIFPE
jgi:serine-type D-Ala-D-Ala carboxypeptidase/endopeptidase (penicillin-binding protein 4)